MIPSFEVDQQADEQRSREHVADGFRAIFNRIEACSNQPRPELDAKLRAALETWQAGMHNLTISLLLDVLIKMYEERAT